MGTHILCIYYVVENNGRNVLRPNILGILQLSAACSAPSYKPRCDRDRRTDITERRTDAWRSAMLNAAWGLHQYRSAVVTIYTTCNESRTLYFNSYWTSRYSVCIVSHWCSYRPLIDEVVDVVKWNRAAICRTVMTCVLWIFLLTWNSNHSVIYNDYSWCCFEIVSLKVRRLLVCRWNDSRSGLQLLAASTQVVLTQYP